MKAGGYKMKDFRTNQTVIKCGQVFANLDIDNKEMRELYVAGVILSETIQGVDPQVTKRSLDAQLAMHDNCKPDIKKLAFEEQCSLGRS